MLYKFVFGKHSYYDLVMTRQVEPQANIERMSEEEDTTDRHDMREIERVAKTRSGTERRCEATSTVRHVTHRSTNAKTTLESATSNPCSGSATNPKMGRLFICYTYLVVD